LANGATFYALCVSGASLGIRHYSSKGFAHLNKKNIKVDFLSANKEKKQKILMSF